MCHNTLSTNQLLIFYYWLSSATCSDSWFASDVYVGLIATLRTIFSVTTAVSARVHHSCYGAVDDVVKRSLEAAMVSSHSVPIGIY